MAEFPKSVIAGMKAQAAPQEHPDANLLAAFAEQALSGRERENMLAHLAVCAACRETVALAAPAAPAQQPASVFVPWYRRPQIFAWAGSLATVALLAALVVNYGYDRYSPRMVTDATPAKVAATPPAENKPAAPASEKEKADSRMGALSRDKSVLDRADRNQHQSKNMQADAQAREERAQAAAPKQVPFKDEKKLEGGSLQSQYSGMKEQPAPPPPPPPAAAPNANVMSEPSPTADMVAQKPKSSATTESVMVQAAPAERSATVASTGAAVGGVAASARVAKMATLPAARWSISEKGKLQRSLDAGRTWQPMLANENALFQSVAVVDREVWAGGSKAVLFHSADAGATWTKQDLPGASGDVVALEFNDVKHGSARTSDGTVWSTNDGGQHWTKR